MLNWIYQWFEGNRESRENNKLHYKINENSSSNSSSDDDDDDHIYIMEGNEKERVQRLNSELHRLESTINSITITLTQCGDTLDSLMQKEIHLREELESFIMFTHDCDCNTGASSSSNSCEMLNIPPISSSSNNSSNFNSVAFIWDLLVQLQKKREHLQEREYRLEITLRCLHAEKKTLTDALEILETHVRRNSAMRDEEEAINNQKILIPPPPVKVEFVEEYR